MSQANMSAMDYLLAILTYPRAFEDAMINFAWGGDDSLSMALLKRSFLLAPVIALIFALWASIPNIFSLVVRSRRLDFVNGFLSAWWDLLHSMFGFMAGIIRMLAVLIGNFFGVLRLGLIGLWTLLLDVVLAPFKAVREVGRNVAAPGLPWIAVVLTVLWCLLEAVIFTYVMTPLVMDTLSNLSGEDLYETSVRIPLFLFMLTVILGSYAVLSAWTTAIRKKDVAAILRITAVEAVAVLLEILFLYREFVDALVPWFAMHSDKNFEPGALLILTIAFMIWLGVRGMTWFLFASHGTPILLAVIQGKGLGTPSAAGPVSSTYYLDYSGAYLHHLKTDSDWLHVCGEEIVGAILLPPMQLVAACLNFLTLLFSGKIFFNLPFTSMNELMESAKALRPSSRKNHPPTPQMHAVTGVTGVQS
jgi:hypothetical protein